MPIEREDWSNLPADGGVAVPVAISPGIQQRIDRADPLRPDWSHGIPHGVPQDGEQVVEEVGLPPSLISEMQRSPGGFELNYSTYFENLLTLEERPDTPKGLDAEVAELPVSLQIKIARIVWHEPGLSAKQIKAKLDRVTTLSERRITDQAWARCGGNN